MLRRRDIDAAVSRADVNGRRLGHALGLLAVCVALPATAVAADSLAGFNARFEDATRHMDNQALAALWEEDGITLLPETPPIVGKRAISAFVEKAIVQFPGPGDPEGHSRGRLAGPSNGAWGSGCQPGTPASSSTL